MTSSPPAPPGTNDQLSPIRSSRPTLRELELDLVAIEAWRAEVTGPPPGARYGAPLSLDPPKWVEGVAAV